MYKIVFPCESSSSYRFDCPRCSWPSWLSDIQLKNEKLTYTCYDCGYIFKPKLSEVPNNVQSVLLSPTLENSIRALVAQGYELSDARDKVKRVYNPKKTVSELVSEAILL